MIWAAKYQAKRDRYWPEVEHFFSSLPPHLFRQAVLLKNNLAIDYTDTGQFSDILRRNHDLPLLYLHFWLLQDWGFQSAPDRIELERHLFLAMVFTFAAVYAQEGMLNRSNSFDSSYLFLATNLTRQADAHLAHLLPGSSSFWDHHQNFWQEYAEANLLTAGPTPPTAESIAGKLAFTKIPIAATTLCLGQETTLPSLCEMMGRLNFILQTRRDLSTLKQDLKRRRYSLSLLRAMNEAGLQPEEPASPETILASLVLTGSIEKIGQACLSQLEQARATAQALQLPAFTAYFVVVENLIGEMIGLFEVKTKNNRGLVSSGPARTAKPRMPFFAPAVDPLARAVRMAEGYLLSDLTFRESWAVQRGLRNLPELTARAFPAGLIVERLCRHGHDLAKQVDEIFQTLQTSRFRYYEEEVPLPPDADDLGLLLRLYRYGTPEQQAVYRSILQKPLGWMEANILPSGQIPVWFKTDSVEQSSILIWGNDCATTETNLLLGLIDYDWSGYGPLIEKSASTVLERFQDRGLGATLYYPPPYILWATFELLSRLAARSTQPALQAKLEQISPSLLDRLQFEAKRATLTPQAAALLAVTCSKKQANHLFQARWITTLLKSQRYDGSWEAEPIFLIPGHEGSAWYSSRSVTTAFCYHALKSYHSR